jgi:hypothetical protein
MKIAMVGGLERYETQFTQIAEEKGHKLGYHSGRIGGRGAKELTRLVDSSSLVIILMTINSHGGVQLAKRTARQRNRASIILMRCGLDTFRDIVNLIDSADSIESIERKYNSRTYPDNYTQPGLRASA